MEPPPQRHRDRISGLPDEVLGHILSYLPNDEAGRAAVLGQRWRYVFGHMHTVSYEEQEGERSTDWSTWTMDAKERKSNSHALLDGISTALLCRRRCSGGHVPLRAFRFAFDHFNTWDALHVDQWLCYVLEHACEELHLKLRFIIRPICARHDPRRFHIAGIYIDGDSDEKEEPYTLPRRLFSCVVLKTLCLAHCRLNLPPEVKLPSLDTLGLTGIRHESERAIQKLVLSCPRLADLTLEAIHHLKTLSILHTRLRRFVLRCCHNAKSLHIDASELVCLEYRGDVPIESLLLTLHGSPPQGIPSCTVNICTPTPVTEDIVSDHAAFRRFLWSFSDSRCLHLHHERLHPACLAMTDGLPLFPWMTQLILQGRVDGRRFVAAVRMILEQSPNLEVLTLYMAEEKQHQQHKTRMWENDDWRRDVAVPISDEASFSTTCLQLRVREINMVHYEGNGTQRALARLLFRNAIVLERLCIVFTIEHFALQTSLRKEIEDWARTGSQRIFL